MSWPPDNLTAGIIPLMIVLQISRKIPVIPLANQTTNKDKVITRITEAITMKIILVEVEEGVAKVGDIKAKDKTNHKLDLNKNKVTTKDIIKAEVKEVGEGDNHKRDTTTPNIIWDKVNTTRVPNMVLPLHHLQHNHLPNMIQIGN